MRSEKEIVEDFADDASSDRWFATAIVTYAIVEAICIVVLMYVWLAN